MSNLKVFGLDAKALETGEQFKVVKYTIEGREVAEFIPIEAFCEKCGEFLKEVYIGHDDYDYVCANDKCSESRLL